MIGFYSWLPKLFFLIVASGFSVGLYQEWRDVRRGSARISPKVVFISIFLVLWIGLMMQLFVREALFHSQLWKLRPEGVVDIEVGDTIITDPHAILGIVDALHGEEWFSVNHGGWGKEVRFAIRLKSGKYHIYHAAQYFRQPGAVLISMSGDESNGKGFNWSNGVIFVPDLPKTLLNSDVRLPGNSQE